MTFTFPEEIASSFVRAIAPSRRSKFVVDAVQAQLRERDRLLMEACIAANNDPETQEIESEFAALPDTMTEDWDESELSPAR
jgi:hypothetical protein